MQRCDTVYYALQHEVETLILAAVLAGGLLTAEDYALRAVCAKGA